MYMCLAYYTAKDDVSDVYEEVSTMAESWKWLIVGLRLPRRIESLIAKKHLNDPEACLLAVVEEWLKGVHNVQKYGHPSWRTLVQAVADPAGGADPALARSIAAKHPGNHSSHVTESPVVSHMLVSPVTSVPGGESDDGTFRMAHHSHGKKIEHDCMSIHILEKSSCICVASYIV